MPDPRRVYYDHESAYKKIASTGGRGWDDLTPGVDQRSYDALDAFLASPWAPAPGASVLDLGCGGGQAAERLARRGCRVLGVDYAETAIELARRNAVAWGLEGRLRFERADVLALGAPGPFDSGPFDLVVDNHLLHCILGADRAVVAASVKRVLRPGGVVLLETMSCEGCFDAGKVRADPVTREALNRSRFWTSRAELVGLLEGAGFTIEELHARVQEPLDGSGSTLVVYARA